MDHRRPRGRLLVLSALALTLLVGREWYLRQLDPIFWRVRDGHLNLPVNQTFVVTHLHLRGCPSIIVHRKNSLGLRGDEPPLDARRTLLILAIGSSTTECFYVDDGEDWPARLEQGLRTHSPALWIGNAGIDGQSTFGHLAFMNDFGIKARPQLALFLMGINDIGVAGPNRNDAGMTDPGPRENPIVRAEFWLRRHSAVAAFFATMIHRHQAWAMTMPGHKAVEPTDLPALHLTVAQHDTKMEENRRNCIPGYRKRVEELVAICRSHGIQPVLITHPAPYGKGRDERTGVAWNSVEIRPGYDGQTLWDVLELYNDVTRSVAKSARVPLIDLAHAMPKSSAYYYDMYHFNQSGSRKVADMIQTSLAAYLPS